MILAPFQPIGNAFIITTAAVANTAQQTPILFQGAAGLNLPSALPTHIRIANRGASDVWFNFQSSAAGSIAIPTAGTTTMGTPQLGMWIMFGNDAIFTINCSILLIPQAGQPSVPGVYMNTISGGVSQTLYCVFGEGL